MSKSKEKKCPYCKKVLQPLNPSVEDYMEHKFCIKLFGWKLILLKESIEMGCPDCMVEEQQSRERDEFDEAVGYAINNEIEKGHLLIKD